MTDNDSGSWTSTDRDRRSQRAVLGWSALWVGAFLICDQAIARDWIDGDPGVIVATVVVCLLALGWVAAYIRFLRNADELVRRIQLEAMAVALGAGLVSGFAIILLEDGDVIEARPSIPLVVMTLGYVVAVIVGYRRFSGGSS